MQEDILLQISSKLKDERKARGVTLQQLADEAQVSKALISQVENNRTIPSLLVLINLIRCLEIDLNTFFQDIIFGLAQKPVIIKRQAEYQHFEKENATGFNYFRILSKSIPHALIDIVLLDLAVGCSRPVMVKTDAFEYKYIIQGSINYHIGEETYTLHEGDSIFFDATLPHRPENIGKKTAKILIIYFFDEK